MTLTTHWTHWLDSEPNRHFWRWLYLAICVGWACAVLSVVVEAAG